MEEEQGLGVTATGERDEAGQEAPGVPEATGEAGEGAAVGLSQAGADGGAEEGATGLATSGPEAGEAAAPDESTLSIDSAVVEKIVAITCRSVDGILQMKGNLLSSLQEGFGGTDVTKGVTVEMVGEDACNVSVSIIMEYGKSAPKIFQELHDRISERITDMTGLKVGSVNVRITDVMTREEIEGGRRREKGGSAAKASSAG